MTFLLHPSLRGLAAAALASAVCLSAAAAPAGGPAKEDGFVAARAKKPGSGVNLAYRIDGTPAAGTPVTLTLRLTGVRADGARIRITSSDGLSVAGERELALAANRELQLSVLATADGVYYVNVASEQGGRAHVTSVPITVGKGEVKLEKNGTAKDTPAGERVISLPSR